MACAGVGDMACVGVRAGSGRVQRLPSGSRDRFVPRQVLVLLCFFTAGRVQRSPQVG